MNRLVIVGNGFDLAHGLPTSYRSFIKDYWKRVSSIISELKCYDDEYLSINLKFRRENLSLAREDFRNIETCRDIEKAIKKYPNRRISNRDTDYNDCKIEYKNIFFRRISLLNDGVNWVDIENEYYKLLKDCLEGENDNSRVKKLNDEFEQVKKLLEVYLNEEVIGKFNFKHKEKLLDISSIFKIDTFDLKEFPPNDHDDLKEFNRKVSATKNGNISNGVIEQINLFLNFNYTKTLELYINAINGNLGLKGYGETYQIQIHGKLNDFENPINFGFGDEMDDDYKKIENKDDNEYLKNIKSFQYFQNSNYKHMLDFVDSGKFQVYIMGHSCGLSDRILLNKIFEHDNCRSIKVFYHEFDKPKDDGRTDNYIEIVQNISRHFNKKEMMREKIVNKSLCKPLPQTIRFAKKENGSQ